MVHFGDQFEDVAVGAVVQDLDEVGVGLQGLVQGYYAGVREFAQD